MKKPEPIRVKKIPAESLIPCAALMYRKRLRRFKQLSGACPNWATVTVQGTPYCAAHAPMPKEPTR